MLCSFTCFAMQLCIFNPEHDLCLAKGRWNYVPPRSAVEFARRDASLMQVLYPDAHCTSVYDLSAEVARGADSVVAWGWDAVVKHELMKRGVAECLLPTDGDIATIRELQHRSTVIPLQTDVVRVVGVSEVEARLREIGHVVLKAPWSGAGRGLRWVREMLSQIDTAWIEKTVQEQGCVIVEPRRQVRFDLALEYYVDGGAAAFKGYSLFRTSSGVYRENYRLSDDKIRRRIHRAIWPYVSRLDKRKGEIEAWLTDNIAPRYRGPLGVDLMVGADRRIYLSEINFRHTMGMVAHENIRTKS